MVVFILTAILSNGIHHYTDDSVYATQEKCEQVLQMMKALGSDELVDKAECREVKVNQ